MTKEYDLNTAYVIRFINSEFVVGKITESTSDSVMVESPRALNFVPTEDQRKVNIVLGNFSFFSNQTLIKFEKSAILCIVEANKDISSAYTQATSGLITGVGSPQLLKS